MSRDASRWWYALLPFPAFVGLRSLFLALTGVLLPAAGPTRGEALPVLLAGIASTLVGGLVLAAAPAFVAGAVLDVRTLREQSRWTPSWAYAVALAAVPAAALAVERAGVLAIPATVAYLVVRRRRVGEPFGRSAPADAPASTPAEPTTGAPDSPWWYGVVGPPALELTGSVVLWAGRVTGVLREGSDPLALLVPAAFVLLGVVLVPVFAVSLYLDARTVRDAPTGPQLDPHVWGLAGLGAVVGLLLVRVTFMLPIALAYEYRRRGTTLR
ncbi:MAG: hypothetical protein ABEI11_02950 [Haloarculaceae archaeon]